DSDRAASAIVWDAITGEKLRTFKDTVGEILAVAYSPDGKQVLIGDSEASAILWDTATGQEARTFQGHAPNNAVAFSPDGKSVATTGWGNYAAALWSIENGERARMFEADPVQVASPGSVADRGCATSIAFSPDGHALLA